MQARVKSWEDLDFTRLNAATLRGLVEITLVEKMAGPRPAIFYCRSSEYYSPNCGTNCGKSAIPNPSTTVKK